MSNASQVYLLNPAVQFFPQTGTESVLCQLQQADGRVIASYQIKAQLQQLLLQFDGQQPLAQIDAHQQLCDSAKLQQLINEFLLPQQILLDPAQPGPARRAEKPAYMLFQLPLLNPALTRLCSRVLQPLFSPALAWPLALAAILSFCYVCLTLLLAPTQLPTEPASSLAAIHTVLLLTLALLLHELGHAAAALRYGCREVRIGVGGYLCFLVFYADLSQSWRLPARQRLVVDLAGSYVQGLVALLYLLAYGCWAYPPLLAAFVLLNLYTLYNLNPFFRMDGYWVASDWLQIPNLRQRSASLLQQFLQHPLPAMRQAWQRRRLSVLAAYTTASLLVFLLFSYIVLFSLTPATLNRLQTLLGRPLAENAASADCLVHYTQIGWNSMIALFLLMYYSMLLKIGWRFYRQKTRRASAAQP